VTSDLQPEKAEENSEKEREIGERELEVPDGKIEVEVSERWRGRESEKDGEEEDQTT